MDKTEFSAGNTFGATAAADMDPMVMMERFSQMQNAVQQMQETMQQLQQEVASFRQQNTRLTSQLHTLGVSNKRARRVSPPTPNSDPQASPFLSPVVIKVEEDDWAENLQAVSETEACTGAESYDSHARTKSLCDFETSSWPDDAIYSTPVRCSCNTEPEQLVQSVQPEAAIHCKMEHGEEMLEMKNLQQGTDRLTIVCQPLAPQVTQTSLDALSLDGQVPETFLDALSLDGQVPEVITVTLQREENSDQLFSVEMTPEASIKTGASRQCLKRRSERITAKTWQSSSSSPSSTPITVEKKRRTTEKASAFTHADDHDRNDVSDLTTACHGDRGSDQGGGHLLVVDEENLEKEDCRLVTEQLRKQMALMEPHKETERSEKTTGPAGQEKGTISESSGATEQTPSQNESPASESHPHPGSQVQPRSHRSAHTGAAMEKSGAAEDVLHQPAQDSSQTEARMEDTQPLQGEEKTTAENMDSTFFPLIMSVEAGEEEEDYEVSSDENEAADPPCSDDSTHEGEDKTSNGAAGGSKSHSDQSFQGKNRRRGRQSSACGRDPERPWNTGRLDRKLPSSRDSGRSQCAKDGDRNFPVIENQVMDRNVPAVSESDRPRMRVSRSTKKDDENKTSHTRRQKPSQLAFKQKKHTEETDGNKSRTTNDGPDSDAAASNKRWILSQSSNKAVPSSSSTKPPVTVGKCLCCYYCRKTFTTKLRRHLRDVHPEEAKVREWMRTPDSVRKALLLDAIRNKGHHRHNLEVIRQGQGQLLVKKLVPDTSYQDYAPCPFCFTYHISARLKHHSKKCHWRPGGKALSLNLGPVTNPPSGGGGGKDAQNYLKQGGKRLVPVCHKLDLETMTRGCVKDQCVGSVKGLCVGSVKGPCVGSVKDPCVGSVKGPCVRDSQGVGSVKGPCVGSVKGPCVRDSQGVEALQEGVADDDCAKPYEMDTDIDGDSDDAEDPPMTPGWDVSTERSAETCKVAGSSSEGEGQESELSAGSGDSSGLLSQQLTSKDPGHSSEDSDGSQSESKAETGGCESADLFLQQPAALQHQPSASEDLSAKDQQSADENVPTKNQPSTSQNLSTEDQAIQVMWHDNRTKKHFCKFCNKLRCKIVRHFKNCHINEPEVLDMVNDKCDRTRCLKLDRLRKMGNHIHNMEVVRKGHGWFVGHNVSKSRKQVRHHYTDYKLCSFCFGYYFNLSRHVVSCPFHHKSHTVSSEQSEQGDVGFDAFVFFLPKAYVLLEEMFLLENSAVQRVSKEDRLMRTIGLSKISNRLKKNSELSLEQLGYSFKRQVKSLARLVVGLQQISEDDHLWLEDVIRPDKVDLIITSVNFLSSAESPADVFINYKSVRALRVILSTRACSLVKLKAKMLKDKDVLSGISDFRLLCQSKWPKVKRNSGFGVIDLEPKKKQKWRKPQKGRIEKTKIKRLFKKTTSLLIDLSVVEKDCSSQGSEKTGNSSTTIAEGSDQQRGQDTWHSSASEQTATDGSAANETRRRTRCSNGSSGKKNFPGSDSDTTTDSEHSSDTEEEECPQKNFLCPETGMMFSAPFRPSRLKGDQPKKVLNGRTGKVSSTKSIAALSRQSWSKEEREAVLRHLAHCIADAVVPRKAAIDKCLENEPALQNRSWRCIKSFCHNLVKKKSR